MCGIVGYAGRRNALPILLDGLKRLEYRGYDSAGVAIVGSALQVVKDKGIIENLASLREKLEARGHTFVSQTDTESLVHLIESYYDGDLEVAVRKALHDVRGSYAILAVHADEPGKVVGARNESPLVVGLGPDENFLASDVPALLRYTDRVLYVMDKEMVVITPKGVELKDLEGRPGDAPGPPREPRGERVPFRRRDEREARRLRHLLSCRPGRQVHPGGDRAHPRVRGAGIGVPLQPRPVRAAARHPDLV